MKYSIYLIIVLITAILLYIFNNNEIALSIISSFAVGLVLLLIDKKITVNQRFFLYLFCYTKYKKTHIRFSISYLFRINIDGKYLFVKGERIKDQFQPIGGVYKRYAGSQHIFDKLEIRDDQHMLIDNVNRDDLRVLVPGANVPKFLKWYNSRRDRETSPEREFREELINSGILSRNNFLNINYRYLSTHETKIQYSEYFKCNEILIADIYELLPNEEQIQELQSKMNSLSDKYVWLEANQVERNGYSKSGRSVILSKTSKWIL